MVASALRLSTQDAKECSYKNLLYHATDLTILAKFVAFFVYVSQYEKVKMGKSERVRKENA